MRNCEFITERTGTWFGNIVEENNYVFIVAMATKDGFSAVRRENGYLMLHILRENRIYRVCIINFDVQNPNIEITLQVVVV